MVNKDSSEKDSSEKKRRKGSSGDSSSGGKQNKEDAYENVIRHEEQEAHRRSADKDKTMFYQTCSELKKIFEEIAALKKDNTEKSNQEIIEKRIQGSLIFVALKKLNRLDKIRLRAGRDALHKEKLRVDSNRLQLQNLLYEANHLKREVQRCYQFKSQDEEIDLVSEEEFYKNAPESISRPQKTKSDEHARRLARLDWELHERKELSALCKKLSIAKQDASKDIGLKAERLNSLAPCLEALLKATRPLQIALEMDIEKEWEVQKSARLLSRPLYLVYANVSAYAEACDSSITTTIEGDEDEAKILDDEDKCDDRDDDDNQESDNEDLEPGNRKVHHKRYSKNETIEIRRKNLLKPHPLSVSLTINKDSPHGQIIITLRYFPGLGFVTAKPTIEINNTGVAAGEVISTENILSCIYADDFGENSPNPKTKYQIEEYHMNEAELLAYLNEQNFGKPYKWAQRFCGIDFVPDKPSTSRSSFFSDTVSYELAQESVPSIVKHLKSRWQARLGLYKQIYALENKNIDLSSDVIDVAPARISSSLVQWLSTTWEEYSSSLSTQRFIEENLVTSHDLFYRAVITRGSAKLECLVCISSDFPNTTPIWNLNLCWNGKHNAINNAAIREMEHWVNSISTAKTKSCILSAQLRRAMSGFDIFLETEGPFYSPAEFTQDKTFLKAFRGRQRSRPYKIVQNGSNVIYKQI